VDESSFGADGHAFGAVENPFSADASLICYYFVFLPIPTDQKKKKKNALELQSQIQGRQEHYS